MATASVSSWFDQEDLQGRRCSGGAKKQPLVACATPHQQRPTPEADTQQRSALSTPPRVAQRQRCKRPRPGDVNNKPVPRQQDERDGAWLDQQAMLAPVLSPDLWPRYVANPEVISQGPDKLHRAGKAPQSACTHEG
eukprot:CAMPEP_0195067388 /NCGR_PEP_ID=MMETSP0448-20130528/12469_1 /TAXON_ID=66468 /ORGANISM="Heterocapsa triquestra, Strain CCMP 448" /LENGTH=136 /DNA_ID=CAMNT_0040098797 /DNA_START=186 /DNA_END=592 /DNA_ORIENTATION=-